jgi:putative spermidine/putrescine transport system substrate-binding protein
VRKRIRGWQVALGVLVAVLIAPAAGVSKTAGTGALPTKIGPGEGALSVVEWGAYTDPSFAKKFEQQTGCKIKRKDAGSSNEMFNLIHGGGGGGGGQYDLVSASGDASLRLIYAGDVDPVNVKLIPSWKNFLPAFKSPPHNTIKGVHYGVSLQWGPNTLIYNTKKVKPAPTSWSAIYSSKYKGKITVPNNPIQIADAALYLQKTKPSLGIRDPYEMTKPQFDAVVALLKQQKPLLLRYWLYPADDIKDYKTGDSVIGATWPYQTLSLQAAKVPVKEIIPKEGVTGWADTWMLTKRAPHPNCAYKWMAYAATPQVQAQQALVFGETPVNPRACPFMNKISKGSCAGYHLNAPASYAKSIRFWKTPIKICGWGGGGNDCMDQQAWNNAWASITG